MSYGLPEQPRRRGGIGKLIFPAIIFFGVMMMFRSMSAPREDQTAPQDRTGQGGVLSPERSAQNDEYRIKEGLFDPKGQPMPSRQSQGTVNNSTGQGKWSMEDVDGNDTQSPKSNKTQKGQWSIEEVDGETTKEKPRFRFSEE